MYVNILVEHSQLFMPLPETGSSGGLAHLDSSFLPEAPAGLGCHWDQLRLGYFYGGDGECILRFNANHLAAVGRLRNGQQQASGVAGTLIPGPV